MNDLVGITSAASVLNQMKSFGLVFFVYSSLSILFVYFLPIGWIDHTYLVVLFGRKTEKDKGMLLEYIHFIRTVEKGELMKYPFLI